MFPKSSYWQVKTYRVSWDKFVKGVKIMSSQHDETVDVSYGSQPFPVVLAPGADGVT